jgi:hypothetical protein
MNFLSTGNAKTIKGEKLGYITGILYLAPHTISGKNVCSFASKGCAAACLFTAGRGVCKNIQNARIRKTEEFFADPKGFIEILAGDILILEKRCKRNDNLLAIRLNGTSDLPFERMGGKFQVSLMERFPQVEFYDYTKNPNRMKAYLRGEMPKNYHLTFSRSENNGRVAEEILRLGGNVAMVFACKKKEELPKEYADYKVVDGDNHDLRFLDETNVIVGLRAKGKARQDKSGFVIKV